MDNLHDHLELFDPYFKNNNVYIVGKGPSLDYLDGSYFCEQHAPILCINEAITIVDKLNLPNPLFGIRQDADLRESCIPSKGFMFVSTQASPYYIHSTIADNTYIIKYNCPLFENYKLSRHSLTAECAIIISKVLKVKYITMLCFDAYHDKNSLTYAKSILNIMLKKDSGKPDRFLKYAKKLEYEILKDINHTWIQPKLK